MASSSRSSSTAAAAAEFLAGMETKLGGVPANFKMWKNVPVFAGQDVTDLACMFGNKIRTGAGLFQNHDRVIATQAGELCFERPNILWVNHPDHRYAPRVDDNVIGVVVEAFSENYKIDIGGTGMVQLNCLAFDGASKRNKPSYVPGTLVFSRVKTVHRDMDPELTCMATGSGPRKDWMTGESMFGELKGGFVFKCSLGLAEELLDEESPVLLALSKRIPFEIAVGANGFVWVNAERPDDILIIKKAISLSEMTATNEIGGMVSAVIKEAKRK